MIVTLCRSCLSCFVLLRAADRHVRSARINQRLECFSTEYEIGSLSSGYGHRIRTSINVQAYKYCRHIGPIF